MINRMHLLRKVAVWQRFTLDEIRLNLFNSRLFRQHESSICRSICSVILHQLQKEEAAGNVVMR